MLGLLGLFASAKTTFSRHFQIHYVVDIADVDTTFMDNALRLDGLRDYLRRIAGDESLTLDSVKFTGTASPDGYYEYNNWLSENRLENLKKILREEINVPDSIIYRNDAYITWKMFRDAVAESDLPSRDTVLAILDMEPEIVPWYKLQRTRKRMNTDSRMLKIRALDGGRVYESLKPILHNLRFADVELVVSRRPDAEPVMALAISDPGTPDLIQISPYTEYVQSEWIRRMYIKNNFLKDALLLPNLSVEIDLWRHWTADLTMFYSCWDYFGSQTKFRFAGFQTELRYWPNPVQNDGWFVGAHFGYSYYNLAFGGEYRYQDLYGKTPTKGGGISIGWRKVIGRSKKWRLEFAAGAGVYPLHYSLFENTPDYKDGQWVEARRKTYIGLDVLSVSIGYAIDLHKYVKFKEVKK